eukprot:TRINITY_DN438_c0_g1_i2.p1 TRINITY_DN438_c0_g1~~TRINITY_DN438_c0_g1_i2.p1  ORF type:complete len:501 (-),score=142.44 TRINITY_DN438_c0_g1_i2:43-1431(-)
MAVPSHIRQTVPVTEEEVMDSQQSRLSRSTEASDVSFFHLSDIHYDPMYSPTLNSTTLCRTVGPDTLFGGKADYELDLEHLDAEKVAKSLPASYQYIAKTFGQVGCDTPFPLMTATFDAMKQVDANPDFILITGDFVGHHLPTSDLVLSTINNVTQTLKDTFPGVPLFPTIGNNDLFPDYTLLEDSMDQWLAKLYQIWGPLIPSDQKQTFLQMGSYSVVLPNTQTRLVVYNSIYYSKKHKPSDSTVTDPMNQFEWLDAQFASAREDKQRVLLATHISPGSVAFNGDDLWHKRFRSQFSTIIQEYQDVISAHLYGHEHRDGFRIMNADQDTQDDSPISGILLAPSITPITGNNPAFRHMSMDGSSSILSDYTDYYADLFHANVNQQVTYKSAYSFDQAYNAQSVTKESLNSLMESINSDPIAFSNWFQRRAAYFEASRAAYLCAAQTVSRDDYTACVAGKQQQ